ncbi:MAG: hypothetical protein ACLGI7_14660, partial [Gammaproteobacteria bacterium]
MNPSARVLLTVFAAASLLAACGLHRIPQERRALRPAPPAQPAPTPYAAARPAPTPPATAARAVAAVSAADTALLAEARERLREAAQAVPAWPDASEVRAMLAAAESAARGGDAAGVRRLSAEVLRRTNDALGVQYLLRAEIELQKVQTYTGLTDEQLERVRVAEV